MPFSPWSRKEGQKTRLLLAEPSRRFKEQQQSCLSEAAEEMPPSAGQVPAPLRGHRPQPNARLRPHWVDHVAATRSWGSDAHAPRMGLGCPPLATCRSPKPPTPRGERHGSCRGTTKPPASTSSGGFGIKTTGSLPRCLSEAILADATGFGAHGWKGIPRPHPVPIPAPPPHAKQTQESTLPIF